MTEQELEQLEALAAAASPPPWVDEGHHTSQDWVVSGVHVIRAADAEFVCEVGYPQVPARAATIAFICAARTAVPALLAEVRRLRALLREVPLRHTGDCLVQAVVPGEPCGCGANRLQQRRAAALGDDD